MFEFSEVSSDAHEREALVEFFRTNGFALVNNVYSPDEVKGLRELYDDIARKREAKGKRPYANAHNVMAAVQAVPRQENLRGLMRELLGPAFKVITTQVMYKPPGSKGFSTHQENTFARAEPEDGYMVAWLALDEATRENGGLYVYPGSHKESVFPIKVSWLNLLGEAPAILLHLLKKIFVGEFEDGENMTAVMPRVFNTQVPERYERAYVKVAAPGAVIFVHGNVVHGSDGNMTDRFRRCLVMAFKRDGATIRSSWLTNRYAG